MDDSQKSLSAKYVSPRVVLKIPDIHGDLNHTVISISDSDPCSPNDMTFKDISKTLCSPRPTNAFWMKRNIVPSVAIRKISLSHDDSHCTETSFDDAKHDDVTVPKSQPCETISRKPLEGCEDKGFLEDKNIDAITSKTSSDVQIQQNCGLVNQGDDVFDNSTESHKHVTSEEDSFDKFSSSQTDDNSNWSCTSDESYDARINGKAVASQDDNCINNTIEKTGEPNQPTMHFKSNASPDNFYTENLVDFLRSVNPKQDVRDNIVNIDNVTGENLCTNPAVLKERTASLTNIENNINTGNENFGSKKRQLFEAEPIQNKRACYYGAEEELKQLYYSDNLLDKDLQVSKLHSNHHQRCYDSSSEDECGAIKTEASLRKIDPRNFRSFMAYKKMVKSHTQKDQHRKRNDENSNNIVNVNTGCQNENVTLNVNHESENKIQEKNSEANKENFCDEYSQISNDSIDLTTEMNQGLKDSYNRDKLYENFHPADSMIGKNIFGGPRICHDNTETLNCPVISNKPVFPMCGPPSNAPFTFNMNSGLVTEIPFQSNYMACPPCQIVNVGYVGGNDKMLDFNKNLILNNAANNCVAPMRYSSDGFQKGYTFQEQPLGNMISLVSSPVTVVNFPVIPLYPALKENNSFLPTFPVNQVGVAPAVQPDCNPMVSNVGPPVNQNVFNQFQDVNALNMKVTTEILMSDSKPQSDAVVAKHTSRNTMPQMMTHLESQTNTNYIGNMIENRMTGAAFRQQLKSSNTLGQQQLKNSQVIPTSYSIQPGQPDQLG